MAGVLIQHMPKDKCGLHMHACIDWQVILTIDTIYLVQYLAVDEEMDWILPPNDGKQPFDIATIHQSRQPVQKLAWRSLDCSWPRYRLPLGGFGLYHSNRRMAAVIRIESWRRWAYLTIATISSPNSSGGYFMKNKWSDSSNEEYLIDRCLCTRSEKSSCLDPTILMTATRSYAAAGSSKSASCQRVFPFVTTELAFGYLESSYCECESSLTLHVRK